MFKVQNYTIDELFQKKLFFPFYIFTHEKRFRVYDTNEKRLDTLKNEYETIMQKLETEMNSGEIDEFARLTILDM